VNISVVIIAKNEADRIGQCIAAASHVSDDVIVLDSGSTDGGYGRTKNMGAKYTKYDWILSLDADEVLSDPLISTIRTLQLTRGSVYLLDRMVMLQGRYIKHCGWHPDWVYRIFHKDDCKWNDALVHEKLVFPADTAICKLEGVLTHYSFRNMEHLRAKINEYAKLAAQEWHAKRRAPSATKRLIGPWWKYIQTYYLYQGYKDGPLGKEIATILADGVRKKLHYYKQLS